MVPPHRVYLDANITIRAFEGTDEMAIGLSHLLTAAPAHETFVATSELAMAEGLVGAIRRANLPLVRTYFRWMTSGPFLEVGPVTRDALIHAAALRAEYPALKLPDAIHLAVAVQMKCSHILTADLALRGRYSLPAENLAGASSATVEVVRPDAEVIRALIAGATR